MNRENYLDVTENIKNLNEEMVVDYKDMKNDDINMVTCTPLLAGRKLNFAPESPFLTANNHLKDATPMMKVAIKLNGDSE